MIVKQLLNCFLVNQFSATFLDSGLPRSRHFKHQTSSRSGVHVHLMHSKMGDLAAGGGGGSASMTTSGFFSTVQQQSLGQAA
jgi:hypothetical protein